MNEVIFPDVSVVRAQARMLWEQKERRAIGIQERIGQSVPWWLVIIAAVFFLLSAPHTASTFDRLTPGWGWVAPVGVEFGLLYAAFRRKQARASGERVPRTLGALELLLFFTAILVNGAGAFISVIESSGLAGLSGGRLMAEFGGLPATSQVALFLVAPAAFIIPVGAGVAGEGLASLLLERRRTGDLITTRWRLVAAEIEFYALRDAALANGIVPKRAIEWAARISGYAVSEGVRPQISGAAEKAPEITEGAAETPEIARKLGSGTGTGYGKNMNARADARAYLQAHPEAAELGILPLTAEMNAAGIRIGKSTVAEVRESFRSEKK